MDARPSCNKFSDRGTGNRFFFVSSINGPGRDLRDNRVDAMEDRTMPESPLSARAPSRKLLISGDADATDSAQVPRMLHFKVPYDGSIVWGQWAEHFNKATGHVHLQGTSSKSNRQIKRWREPEEPAAPPGGSELPVGELRR
jgi:hypothetical protein